MDFPLTIVFTL